MKIVHQLRAGAPDKIMLWIDGTYKLKKHDNTNLVNYLTSELVDLARNKEYILPADEGDIKHANIQFDGMKMHGVDQEFILLPQTKFGDSLQVIDYFNFVPKDSFIYKHISENTSLKYARYESYSLREFRSIDIDPNNKVAYKTTTGSGSRGVILIDPSRVHLGHKYRSKLDLEELHNFIRFAENENCYIMIQQLIPNNPKLTKINVDFVIRNGRLLGYKWDKTDPKAVFTNWDQGWTVVTDYTDKMMTEISDYLIKNCGIYNAIMNFEAFSDMKSETWLVEFNWRYSNSMFEGQAAGIDLIGCYLNDQEFRFPEGYNKFSRYWQCTYYHNMDEYHEGK